MNVKDRAAFVGGEGELLCIGDRVLARFFGPQNIVAAISQIGGQSGHDVAIEVEPNEQRFKAG